MNAADAGVRNSSFVLLAVAMLAIGLDVGVARITYGVVLPAFARPATQPDRRRLLGTLHLIGYLLGTLESPSLNVKWSSSTPHNGSYRRSGDLHIDAESFRCITRMTHVRQFYVDNSRGNLDATLAAAISKTSAVYPAGSVIQLAPGEAMVKRDKGFNTATHDWEFFELDVSRDGTPKTRIRRRRQSIRRELLWMSHCSPSAVGSRVRSRPRLRSNPGYANRDWRSAKNGSPVR